MASDLKMLIFVIGMSLSVLLLPSSSLDAEHGVNSKPKPKIVKLDTKTADYQRVLGGPPETVTMHSGLVVLAPGKSVGVHNTEKYEEVLVCSVASFLLKLTATTPLAHLRAPASQPGARPHTSVAHPREVGFEVATIACDHLGLCYRPFTPTEELCVQAASPPYLALNSKLFHSFPPADASA